MSDKRLTEMLDEVEIEKNKRDQAKRDAEYEHARSLRASGNALATRLLPRLAEAQGAWKSRVKIEITDRATEFRETLSSPSPQVEVTVKADRIASYAFVTPAASYVHVVNLTGNNKGNNVDDFKIQTIDDLTDDKIDEVLQEMLRIAHGLKEQR